jgi:hypothetical protein
MRLWKRFVRGAFVAALLLATLYFATAAYSLIARAAAQGGAQVQATTSTGNGLRTFTFDTSSGRIYVRLPDDMRAGDTVSGTLVSEPRGGTEAERAKNLDALKVYQVDVGGQKVTAPEGRFTLLVPPLSIKPIIITDLTSGKELANAPVPAPAAAPPMPPGTFQLPTLGQQGRPIEIHGPFDGNASNTTFSFIPRTSVSRVDSEPAPVRPIAESPRKMVFESPPDLTGLAEIVLSESGTVTRGPYRNVSVRLSAPKTNLMRGERTTLTVAVGGLDGIREDVPLQLDARGVIQMDGGNFQNLRIRPQEIRPDGIYTTDRAITGQQAGGFNVTATVIVRRFDMCLQDDRDPRSLLSWNSFTGDYVFIILGPGGQPTAGGKMQPGGGAVSGGAAQTGGSGGAPTTTPAPSPGGLNLMGTGKPSMKGCIITLSHNAPDRRIFARLDTCTKTGSGEVEQSKPKSDSDIKDSNISDSTCPGN